MFRRIAGVFGLKVDIFEEIEHDQGATGQAALVVAIVAILSALGSGITGSFTESGTFLGGFLSTLVWTFIGWILWSAVTYLVGTAIFRGQATLGEMLRVIGFAYAPQALGIIPCIGPIIGSIWSLIAGFVAVRQGLDLDNVKALLTILIGFFVYIIGWAIVALLLGGLTSIF